MQSCVSLNDAAKLDKKVTLSTLQYLEFIQYLMLPSTIIFSVPVSINSQLKSSRSRKPVHHRSVNETLMSLRVTSVWKSWHVRPIINGVSHSRVQHSTFEFPLDFSCTFSHYILWKCISSHNNKNTNSVIGETMLGELSQLSDMSPPLLSFSQKIIYTASSTLPVGGGGKGASESPLTGCS